MKKPLRPTGLLLARALMILTLPLAMVACTPTVQMAAPKEPITVNLNVKIQHEIYVKVDKDVEDLFSEKGLF
ncbi:YnbE family lipoprotein [Marinobacter guineae]|uniref:YnbE family lipoprotein n=1 Tax=Marinobacter guineae TaxID=432303 RepID=A0A2G1VCN4_9GAMM|nr:YnbE family lipoprotein [Marinobacter guineae]